MGKKKKIIRATTVPQSLDVFCKGLLKELSGEFEVVALSSPGEAMDRIAVREGVRTISVPMERHISFYKDLKSLLALNRVFRKEKPHMVHSMTPKAGLLCMMAAWWTKVPIRVHTFTGLVFPTAKGVKRKVLMLTDKITCACATHIIPEGEGVKNDLVINKITKKPLRVLGFGNVRGVDMEYYSKREEVIKQMEEMKLRDDRKFTFLFVGRIVQDKGINELVEAFERLYCEHPEIRLFLVGSQEDNLDPIKSETRAAVASFDGIFAVGKKMGDELLSYYSASDCFVLPSYREGFPNTVLEAGAMGLPSIVTNVNGSREIIKEGYNGLIVLSHDATALYVAMKRMVENTDERLAMAAVARQHISSHYEQGFVRKCLYDYYKTII